MQDCFRKYPEIYGSELTDEEEEDGAPAPEGAAAAAKTTETETSTSAAPPAVAAEKAAPKPAEEGLPKKAVDATDANKSKEK